MDDRQVARLWDENAETWTHLARQGYDVYRDLVNTPAFLGMLPAVKGLRGLDVGCGEGHNTRLVGSFPSVTPVSSPDAGSECKTSQGIVTE